MFGRNPSESSFKKSIDTGKAKEIKTDIDFLAGELHLDGTSGNLADCYYGFGKTFLRPDMTYHEVGKTGYLSLSSESLKGKDLENLDDNEWFVQINPDIRNSLSIKLKGGESDINLEGCRIDRFEYRMMAGESKVNLRNTSVPAVIFNLFTGEASLDLSGKWHNDLEANIKGGIGELEIKVPYDTGVRIAVSGLIGEVNIPFFERNGKIYTNGQYGKSKYTLYLNVEAGIGQIDVKMVE